jgi:hypothetical protein
VAICGSAGRQIRAGDLQVHGGLLFGFLTRVEQANCGGAVVGAEALLFAGHVIVNVVATAVISFIKSVSLSHNCVNSDEVTTVDLHSGTEQVGVTHGRPELHFAGTSAGNQLWKSSKPLQFQLVRFGGEGRNRTRPAFHKPLEINYLNHHRCLDTKGFPALCQG